jgi:hypothetical protein
MPDGNNSSFLKHTSFLYRCPLTLTHGAVFWILMSRSLLIRDRELTSSDIFLGRVVVFSGGLDDVECLPKNGIGYRPLLDGFGFVHWCSAYIRSPFVM